MPILIRDKHFEGQAKRESRRRRHKSVAKTVQELATERLHELQSGQFIPGTNGDREGVTAAEPAKEAAATA